MNFGKAMKCVKRFVLVAFVLALAAPAAQAITIKKCKDSSGRWHYGDYAAEECRRSRSKVIEMQMDTGARRVIDPPPTRSELKAKRAAEARIAREKEIAAKNAARDEMLLQAYAHEDDIISERDRKLKELQDGIESRKATLASLRSVLKRHQQSAADEKKRGKVSKNTENSLKRAKSQVKTFEDELESKRQELTALRQKYQIYLERYRAIKKGKKKIEAEQEAGGDQGAATTANP